jgi:4-amino-4-deoxyprephenate dehydrogenase
MPEPRLPFTHAVVVGANGAVGALFCAQLTAAGCDVTAIDLGAEARPGLKCSHYVSSDARQASVAAQHALAAAHLVVLAVPEAAALNAWTKIARHLSAGSLTVDTLSVKGAFCEAVRQHGAPGEYLSINPMFAPSAGFAGNNVAAVRINDGALTASFLALLESWGSHIAEMTAEQHDRLAAAVQVATHAALLAFGMTLRTLNYDAVAAAPVATPPHRTALSLLARILAGAPEVYWEIQFQNPHAKEVRRAMAANLDKLSRIVADDDFSGFRSVLADLKPLLNALPN